MKLIGGGIGELLFVIVAITYLKEEGKGVEGEVSHGRPAFLVAHLLLILVALEVAIGRASTNSTLWTWLSVGNIFALLLLPLVVVKTYPTKVSGMIATTVGPWVLGVVWTIVTGVVARGSSLVTGSDLLWQPLVFLGLHHLALLGPLFLLLILNPPAHAAARQLPPWKRFIHPAGLFIIAFSAGCIFQAVLVFRFHWNTVFGSELRVAAVGAGLFGISLLGSLPGLKRSIVRGV
jgi:hypothetical protein